MEIIPSILTASESQFTEQLQAINKAPVKTVHIDIADGEFVSNITFADPQITKKISQHDVVLHLMVTDPLKVLPFWTSIPNVKRVLFHYESSSDVSSVIDAIHAQGWEAGLVLNPHTPWDVIEPFAEKLDSVMFMGIVPGVQGNPFIPEVLEKAEAFKTKYSHLLAEWDGAVTEETICQIKETGVDVVCPGHAVFGSGDPVQNVVKLQNLIK